MTNWIKNWIPGKFETYRQRVRDIKAFRYSHEAEPDWYKKLLALGGYIDDGTHGELKIKTPNGWTNVPQGAWVICDSDGTLGWIWHDQFILNYEPTPEYAKLVK